MAVTNRSQLANGTQTQQGLYNQSIARKAQLENQQKYLQMAQASPAFAIGNLIGNLLADSYNSRGVNKEKQAISDALANYKGDNNYNAMNGILNSAQMQNGTTQNMVPGEGVGAGVGNVNLGNNILPAQSENSVTPELPTGQSMNSFDLDKFKSKYFEDARKRGRTDAQINEAWSTMQPQITELANKAKEARIDTALQAMTPDENGKYVFGEVSMANPQFINYLRPLMKDNPEMATYLMKGATAKDSSNAAMQRQAYANAAKLDLQNRNQQFQLGRDNTNNAIKIALAQGKLDKQGANSDYKQAFAAGKAYDALEKKYQIADPNDPTRMISLPMERWSAVDRARANQYMQLMGFNNPQGAKQTDNTQIKGNGTADAMPKSTMDYDSLNSWVTKAISEGKERGLGRQAIEGIIRDSLKGMRQDGDYLDKILNEAAWDSY